MKEVCLLLSPCFCSLSVGCRFCPLQPSWQDPCCSPNQLHGGHGAVAPEGLTSLIASRENPRDEGHFFSSFRTRVLRKISEDAGIPLGGLLPMAFLQV